MLCESKVHQPTVRFVDLPNVTMSLERLKNILKAGEGGGGVNFYVHYNDEAEGLVKMRTYKFMTTIKSTKKHIKILKAYWMEEDNDQNVAL